MAIPRKEPTLLIEVEPGGPFPDDALTGAIGAILSNEAMEYPVHMVALACNGAGYIARYVLREDGEGVRNVTFLAEHEEEDGMMVPVHALLMDSNGHTARIVITTKEKERGN